MGAVVGAVEAFVMVFIALYVLSLPIFNITFVENSKWKNQILNNTPVLSAFSKKTMGVVKGFSGIKEKYEDNNKNAEEFNKEVLDLFLKYDVVKVYSIDKLVEKGKLQINNIEEILMKYREG